MVSNMEIIFGMVGGQKWAFIEYLRKDGHQKNLSKSSNIGDELGILVKPGRYLIILNNLGILFWIIFVES